MRKSYLHILILASALAGCKRSAPPGETKSWSQEVWEKGSKVYNEILAHPFIQELAAGTLPEERFIRYLAQDEIYIGTYGQKMFQLADLAQDPEVQSMIRAYAVSGIDSEKEMHQLLIDRFGMDATAEPSVVTTGYSAHEQAVLDSGRYEIALAAMMPCLWIYNRVGEYTLGITKLDGNPYREWIEEYGDEESSREVDTMLETVDAMVDGLDPKTRETMTEVFLKSLLYEYAFWDYGYYGDEKDYSYIR